MAQADLFGGAAVAGLRYGDELFGRDEEQGFVRRFEQLAFQPFEFHGHLGNRRIVSFGWRYDYGGRRLRQAAAMPDFLAPLRDIAAGFSGLAADSFEHALVTEYRPGAGIGWHRDKPMFRHVMALSFLAPCRLRLRRALGARWERQALAVAPRSGYLLQGEARSVWEHSIPAVEQLRYSVTFRDFQPGHAGPPE